MKLIPLGDKVVVRPVDTEETTAGGIVLPDAAQENNGRAAFSRSAMADSIKMAVGPVMR